MFSHFNVFREETPVLAVHKGRTLSPCCHCSVGGRKKMIFKYEQIYLNFIRMHAHIYDHCQHAFWYEFQWLCSVNSFLSHSLLKCNRSWHNRHAFLSPIYKIYSNKMCVKSNDVVPWESVFMLTLYIKKDVCEVTLFDDDGNIYSSFTMESTSEKGIENGKQMLVYMIFNYR